MDTLTLTVSPDQTRPISPSLPGSCMTLNSYNTLLKGVEQCEKHGLTGHTVRIFFPSDTGYLWQTNQYMLKDRQRKAGWSERAGLGGDFDTDVALDEAYKINNGLNEVDYNSGAHILMQYWEAARRGHCAMVSNENTINTNAYINLTFQALQDGYARMDIKPLTGAGKCSVLQLSNNRVVAWVILDGSVVRLHHEGATTEGVIREGWNDVEVGWDSDRFVLYVDGDEVGSVPRRIHTGITRARFGMIQPHTFIGAFLIDDLVVGHTRRAGNVPPYWHEGTGYVAHWDFNDTKATVDDTAQLLARIDAKVIWSLPTDNKNDYPEYTTEYNTDLAAYLNAHTGPMAQLRREHGHPDPYNHTYFEIGNEPYFIDKWKNNRQAYARMVADHAQQLRRKSPIPIKVGIHTERRSGKAWIPEIWPIAGEHIDFISLFHEYPGSPLWQNNLDRIWWYNCWNATGNTWNNYVGNKGEWGPAELSNRFIYSPYQARMVLEEIDPVAAQRMEYYITEYNDFLSPGRWEGNWHGDAISLGNALGAWLEAGLDGACKWSLAGTDFGFPLVVSHDTRPYIELPPHFEVMKLYQDLPDTYITSSSSHSRPAYTWHRGQGPGDQFKVPYGSAWATKRDGRLFVWAVNSSEEDDMDIRFEGVQPTFVRGRMVQNNGWEEDNEVAPHDRGDRMRFLHPGSDEIPNEDNIRIRTMHNAVVPRLGVALIEYTFDGSGGPGPEPDEASYVVSPASLDFGDMKVGDQKTMTVRVNNTDDVPLAFNAWMINAGVNFSVDIPSFSLSSGEHQMLVVTFSDPPQMATYADSLRIECDRLDNTTIPLLANVNSPSGGEPDPTLQELLDRINALEAANEELSAQVADCLSDVEEAGSVVADLEVRIAQAINVLRG